MEGRTVFARPARFGAFEVDLRAGELRKQGLKIQLQQQPLQVLAMLLQRPGEVVTREELRNKLWPANTFVDFDHSLSKAIIKIREALGDSAETPRFIETLPRQGYRFIAPVDRAGSATAPAATAPVTTSRTLARALLVLIQAGYLTMYGAAIHYLPKISGLGPLLHVRNVAFYVLLCVLCGTAFRLYLISAVALDYPDSGRLFRLLFPAILVVDLAWAASPLLLSKGLGEMILLFVAGLAFLPFSQRSLVYAAYAQGGGKIGPTKDEQVLNRLKQEAEGAREMQQGLLPRKMPQLAGLQISGTWQPARLVSGDYYDLLRFDEHRVALCIGDVVGKGMPAALLMSNLQAAVKAFASASVTPEVLCEQVNQLTSTNIARGKFITFFYGLVDAEARRLVYTNAGHNPPIVMRHDGTVLRLDEGGALLGVFPDWKYRQGQIELLSGDRVLLFTDGASEAQDSEGHEFGEERLIQLLRDTRELGAIDLQHKVLEALAEFSRGDFHDDVTLIAMTVQ